PRLRQRDLAADAARAHENRVRATALHIQDLKPLPVQRMERVSDNYRTRRITGNNGTMPCPSAPRGFSFRHAISVSLPPSPEVENTSPRTSGALCKTPPVGHCPDI